MPAYQVISQTSSGNDVRVIMANDLADLAPKIKAALGAGLGVNQGQREPVVVSVTRLNVAALITPNANPNNADVQTTTDVQPALADLPENATVTTFPQAQTACRALAADINDVKAALRAAGILAT